MEERGLTQIYCGPGKGKTSVAIGRGSEGCWTWEKGDRDPVSQGEKQQHSWIIFLFWNQISVCSDLRRKISIMRI